MTNSNQGERVTKFCQQVKNMAKTFKTFDEFFNYINRNTDYKKIPVRRKEMDRLVQVAAIEANLY